MENGVTFQDCDDDGETAAEVDYYICYKYVSIMKYYYFLLISSEFVYTNFFCSILFEDDGCMECYSCG